MTRGYVALTAFVLVLVIAWNVMQWNECRAAGLSAFYCLQHIG